MQLVDTHCHLNLENYNNDLDLVLERAGGSGVVRMIVPGIDVASSQKAVELSKKHYQIFAAVGIHPHSADEVTDKDLSFLKEIITNNNKIVAVGEIGLDYYKKYSDPENQKTLFERCLSLAKEVKLPVILHNREASSELLTILKNTFPDEVKGVMHCFSADKAILKKVLDMGLYVSFPGNITFPKAEGIRDLIRYVPLEKLFLETDSPYMTPVPFRGKRNEPAYVRNMLDIYANIYRLTPEDVARTTTHNANQLFDLDIEEESMIAYAIRDSLYLNITNRCTNRCVFCVRQYSDYVKGHNLKLSHEPSVEKTLEAMGDISGFDEVVFCGYGEPTIRMDIIKEIASYVKREGGKVRLTTNGQGDLINGREIAQELSGLVDNVSVSLNAPNSEAYDKLCRSDFGREAYDAMIRFIESCQKRGIDVELTCLDMIGEEAVGECKEIARKLDVNFRLRYLDAVG
ncbi:MAG: YchF/TatD family DNA exonuclease [Candidatus Omnitrophica bacterium]|nr:YchF/TatD family DNA exonuclease [Candidatus Omnitrophota bacterium]